jgi:SAM-dependent MidA family methyltransferase
MGQHSPHWPPRRVAPEPDSAGPLSAAVPPWLEQRLRAAGGAVPFRTFMEWALHDPLHGAYGSGRLRIGPRGDFATSPSLGPAFARLLAPQLLAWLRALDGPPAPGSLRATAAAASSSAGLPLALVETGPGEGHLARQLATELVALDPPLAGRLELVLVEPNAGMAARQREVLADAPLPVRWCSWEDLAAAPRRGVMLAHEVLDALAVERVVWDGRHWRRQGVALAEAQAPQERGAAPGASTPPAAGGASLRWVASSPLSPDDPIAVDPPFADDGPPPGLPPFDAWSSSSESTWLQAELAALGLDPPPQPLPAGWCSELHPGLAPWLAAAAAGLAQGPLLVIDYALEARRYYAPSRRTGTLMAYRRQQASSDALAHPGSADLTAHLCLETLRRAAASGGWRWRGECRQGQALLALGLAQALHRLQDPAAPADLAARLAEREALLRLVDPAGLGEFRWIALERGEAMEGGEPPRFLQEPVP